MPYSSANMLLIRKSLIAVRGVQDILHHLWSCSNLSSLRLEMLVANEILHTIFPKLIRS